MQVFTDDGTRIDVAVDGDATDAIVLLAGFPLSKSAWDEHVAPLTRTHRVVRPDLRGMGASSVPDGPYLMETLAGDVAAVMDACGIERATIAGHSMGGYVTLAFARMFTERVERLALVCSHIDADESQVTRRRYELAARTEAAESIEPVVDAYLDRLLAPDTFAHRPDVVERVRRMIVDTAPQGAAEMLRGMAERVASDDIAADLHVPVAVIAGSKDGFVPPERARTTAAAFPRGRAYECERSGHVPMLEEPVRLGAVLRELLETPLG